MPPLSLAEQGFVTPLAVDDFVPFFKAVHGYEPFDWQMELVRRVIGGEGWPEGVDVPTGLGKTAVIDIAVFALAVQAGLSPQERTAATRTFVVVDRRLIVDQAFERAEKIRVALIDSGPDTIVGRVGAALLSLNPEDSVINPQPTPLRVVRMRGGATWSSRWLAHPAQPAVVVATVDQFGSRLLFRGYGVSDNGRPIDAALCGVDSLLILDEAHLSQPMIETALAAAAQEERADQPLLPRRRPKPVLLSATLPSATPVFRPDLVTESSPVARRRLDVERVAHLITLDTGKDAGAELAGAMATLAARGLGPDSVERVAVVCNTVGMARQVFDQLSVLEVEADLALLIGRCRQVERDVIVDTWLPRLKAVDSREPAERPIIAVATQTIEVGADLDFDLMVTEACPIDSLFQRLGRLNRFGRANRADAFVVHACNRHNEDPVYGESTKRTWTWLVGEAGAPGQVKVKDVNQAAETAPTIELGPTALHGLLSPALRRTLAAEPPLAPVVLGPVLDAWARTSPSPVPDQPVAPYLHGLTRPVAEVLVCWRAGLPSPNVELEVWEEELRTAPPTSVETVAVPIWEAERFLAGEASPSPLSDIEGAGDLEFDLDEREPVSVMVLSSDGEVMKAGTRSLRPGDTVVAPSTSGGHDQWGWTGRPGPDVPDVADLAQRRNQRLRLRPEVLALDPAHPDFDDVVLRLSSLREELKERATLDPDVLKALLGRVEPLVGGPFRERLRNLVKGLAIESPAVSTGANCLMVKGRARSGYGVPGHGFAEDYVDDDVGDEDELSSSAAAGRITLSRHLWDVARGGEIQARLIGLPENLVRAVELAGRAHDLGKADDRFQAMLHRGDALAALASPEPLAKSGMDSGDRAAYRRAREASKWPAGMRHEVISAALITELVRTSPELFVGLDVELVHHLVQSHHGRARPLLPPIIDDDPRMVTTFLPGPDVSCQVSSQQYLVDWAGPDRFARLGRRYGWWGLALLESIVRLADMAASKSYEREVRT